MAQAFLSENLAVLLALSITRNNPTAKQAQAIFTKKSMSSTMKTF